MSLNEGIIEERSNDGLGPSAQPHMVMTRKQEGSRKYILFYRVRK